MRPIRSYFALPSADRKLVWRLLVYILRAEFVFNCMPYDTTRKLIFEPKPIKAPPPADPFMTLQHLLELLGKLCRSLPWTPSCLRQAVALRDALAADGIEACIRLGLRQGASGFDAHAWLECLDREVLKNGEYSLLIPSQGGEDDKL